ARFRVTKRKSPGYSPGLRHVDLYRLDSGLPLGLLATERERRIILDQVLPLVATVEAHAALVVATGRDLATIQIIIPREGRVGDYTVRILNLPVPVALEVHFLVALVGVLNVRTDDTFPDEVAVETERVDRHLELPLRGVGLSKIKRPLCLVTLLSSLRAGGVAGRGPSFATLTVRNNNGKNRDDHENQCGDADPLKAATLLLFLNVNHLRLWLTRLRRKILAIWVVWGSHFIPSEK